ncbi:MAG: hypothetical protein DMG12_26230 [Acidobacteria bacterium]|nr:MAG: hypothetical protein DMG12_26230 [Acidobacteriota bacterium]
MKRLPVMLALVALMLIRSTGGRAQEGKRKFVPVTDAMLQNPDPANWMMWRRTLDSWGYSPLSQVNRNNVSQLRLVWTRGLGPGNSQEATPLVYDGVMYIPNPGDYIQALDAKTGDLIWEYQRQLANPARRSTKRNIAIYGTNIIHTTSDNYLIALDAQSGKLTWETQILDPAKPANASSGPIVANGKVISGRQCQPGGGFDACVITAHDAKTGKELWRTHTMPRPGESRAESDLCGNVCDYPCAEIHPRRQREQAPVPQLHPCPECGHRKDRVVLPAHCRSLGPRSPIRTPAGRHDGDAESPRRPMDQSEAQARRTPQSGDGNSRKDRHCLHAGSKNG